MVQSIDEERLRKRRLESENNTYKTLLDCFEELLISITLQSEKGGSDKKKEQASLKKEIKNLADYRLKENILVSKSKLYCILLKIKKSDLKSKQELEEMHKLILNNSPCVNGKSRYKIMVEKKLNNKKGEGIISSFFKLIGINK